MLIEDFTHVLPEDKLPKAMKRKNDKLFSTVFDLEAANRREEYYRAFREQMMSVKEAAIKRMQAKKYNN